MAGYTYLYDFDNRITSMGTYGGGGPNYTYDDAGQLTSEGSTSYVYYNYDSNGNRTDGRPMISAPW